MELGLPPVELCAFSAPLSPAAPSPCCLLLPSSFLLSLFPLLVPPCLPRNLDLSNNVVRKFPLTAITAAAANLQCVLPGI